MNNYELVDIFGVELEGLFDIEKYVYKILDKGVKNVIVFMVGDGVLLVILEVLYFVKLIKGEVKNFVGVGDLMVVGFIGEFVKLKNLVEVLKWGVVCGIVIIFLDDLVIVEFI